MRGCGGAGRRGVGREEMGRSSPPPPPLGLGVGAALGSLAVRATCFFSMLTSLTRTVTASPTLSTW